jgi:hypothetical protein
LKKRFFGIVTALFLGSGLTALAQAPAGATGQCKDGTFTTAAVKKGACADHRGVKTWFKPNPVPSALPSADSVPSPSAIAPSEGASTNASVPAAPAQSVAAPKAESGQVWLNTTSNVYHCPDSTYYGKTHNGAYMTEAEAKSKGARPAYNKPCTVN